MKAWLRAAMAALLVGTVVYLLWEEKYKRALQIFRIAAQNETALKLQQMNENTANLIEAAMEADKRAEAAFDRLGETMRHSDETLQRLVDETDMAAVALGHPELARDPVSAKFRLAIEEKRRKSR